MSTTVEKKQYTPEDLLTMPDGNRYELVDGELVETDMSAWSSYVAGNIYIPMKKFADKKRLGWVLPEGTSYQCFPNAPQKVRKPDTSFIRLDRLSLAEATEVGHLRVAPDLAVEVISPNDLAYKVDQKIQEYLDAGVELIWVVNPKRRTVQVYRLGGRSEILSEKNTLDGEDVLPGFRLPIRKVFLPPGGAK